MIKYKTYVYRIYPNKNQINKIKNNFECVRFVYNKLLSLRKEIYNSYKLYIRECSKASIQPDKNKIIEIDYMPSLSDLKEEYTFLKEADSLALNRTWNSINEAFLNFHKHKCKFPRYKSRKNKRAYETRNVNNNIRIEENKIRLPKIGFIKIKLHRNMPNSYYIRTCTITEDKCGKYYVKILVKYEENIEKIEPNNIVGLDFKMRDMFVSSNNENGREDERISKLEKEVKYLFAILKNKNKGSNSWNKTIYKIRKTYRKIVHIRNNKSHNLSAQLCKRYDGIAIEHICISEMAKEVSGKDILYNTAYYNFCKMLKYKLKYNGKQLIRIYRWFASSKICCKCGNRKEKLLLSERIYICDKCGNKIDRDVNAAINIRDFAIWMLNNS